MTEQGPASVAVSRPRRRLAPGPSLQRRVGRFALLIVALAVLLTGLGAYVATRASTFSAVDGLLLPASEQAERELGPAPDDARIEQFVRTNAELGVVVTAIVSADGTVLRSPGAVAIPVTDGDVAVAADHAGPRISSVTLPSGELYRVRVVPVGEQPGRALLVARTMAATQQILRALLIALVAFGLLAVVAAGIIGRRLARAAVAPVRELTGEVEQRAADDDLRPVPVVRDDEIGRLTIAFNHLLDTVTVSRVRQVRFVADAGHELRTPLTSLRTNIELLAADTEHAMLTQADRLVILRDVRAQLIEFSELVSDLIGLTRQDPMYAELDEIDLTAVLEEAVDRVSMRAPGVGWAVQLDAVHLQGDADLLARAFTNVLDNAVKYSPPGGTVSVTLHDGEVRIGDEGSGVSLEERPFVFDRFFRAEAARATPGTGLGLSITESVVRQHGGTVAVTDSPSGGALFVLTFPMATRRSGSGATGR